MRMSTASKQAMTNSKSTLSLFNNDSRKNLHRKRKSFGPISVLSFQD